MSRPGWSTYEGKCPGLDDLHMRVRQYPVLVDFVYVNAPFNPMTPSPLVYYFTDDNGYIDRNTNIINTTQSRNVSN